MMNKDEATNKLSKAAGLSMAHAEDLYDSFFPKPVVPQYVADWYEGHKNDLNEDIWEYLTSWADTKWDEFKYWMYHTGRNKAITTLVNMRQFGYEVEKEKEYVIELKETPQILLYDEKNEEYYFAVHRAIFSRDSHTRKELEDADFGWVFDCPGVEVKEVE